MQSLHAAHIKGNLHGNLNRHSKIVVTNMASLLEKIRRIFSETKHPSGLNTQQHPKYHLKDKTPEHEL